MVVKNIIKDMLPSIWPMLLFISVVAITLRVTHLLKGSRKFSLHKEILSLIFILYILCLYYILMYQDVNYGGINLVPFKEMFRYSFGSYKFMKNVVGNVILFIPFGFFASYYLNEKKLSIILIVTAVITFCAEAIQYYIGRVFDIDDIILNVIGGICGYLLYVAINAIKNKLPRFMRSDAFINFLIITIVVLIVLYSFGYNVLGYLF